MQHIVDFPNGDYVIFSENTGNILFHRRRMVTAETFGYDVTQIAKDASITFGPLYFAVQSAIAKLKEIGIEWKAPTLNDCTRAIAQDNAYETIERVICHQTGQSVVRVKAVSEIKMEHPLHPGNEERFYIVERGQESGWMPENVAHSALRVWVDNSSSLLGSVAQNCIVTNNSKVHGSEIKGSWIRKSNVDYCTAANSIVQTSNVVDGKILGSGVRKSQCNHVELKNTSILHSTLAMINSDNSRVSESNCTNSVLSRSTLEKVQGFGLRAIESALNHVTANNSCVLSAVLREGMLFSSLLDYSKQRDKELGQFLINFNRRIDTGLHKVTVREVSK